MSTRVPFIFAAIVGLAVSTGVRAEDWPRYLGAGVDGVSHETNLKLDWGLKGPAEAWSVPVGEGYAMASIADGRVFVFDRKGNEARLRAFAEDDGKLLWDARYTTDYEDYYQFSNGPRTPAIVDGDHVYTYGVEGKLRCHAVSDGEVVWQVDTSERFGVVQNFFGVGSSPFVWKDLLIVMVGGSPPGSPSISSGEVQPASSALAAFDKTTGKLKWKAGNALASYASPTVVDIDGKPYGLAFMREGLLGFDPSDGSERFLFPWRSKKLQSVNAANPVVVGKRVFVTESYGPGGALVEIRGNEVELLRQDPRRGGALKSHWSTPIHRDGVLYGCHGEKSATAEFRAVDFETGEVHWAIPDLLRTTAIWVDGHLLVLGEDGRLHRVPAGAEKPKKVVSTKKLVEQWAWSPPALANGRLYLQGSDRLAVFDLRAAKGSAHKK